MYYSRFEAAVFRDTKLQKPGDDVRLNTLFNKVNTAGAINEFKKYAFIVKIVFPTLNSTL